MVKRTNLLKILGWDDALIKHYMIDNNECDTVDDFDIETETFDSNNLTVTFDANNSGSFYLLKNK